ncbi:protein lifeguard 1 [Zeugodacus cucurbitae]|uniref:Protein lifeguard 2 n=1 Tax=Zeugodacus cucurbitae TaxID=28588 RepID=A0A0A1XSQ1_ZEUCU|nr:protein lifeguard 1 [Zeugodacus cucurbitae]
MSRQQLLYKMQRRDLESLTFEDFDDKYVRHAFITKVFGIIAVQLMVTFAIIFTCIYVDEIQDFLADHHWLMWVALGAVFVIMIPIACCEGVRRSFPLNFILLILFTLAESFLLSFLAIKYSPDTVLYALGITTLVVLVLTVFAMQTAIDFTSCGAILLVGSIILLIIGLVAIFVPSRTLMIVYCSIGIVVFSFYLIFDIQMMLGGNHRYQISPEDYIFAALSIYIDIVTLFMYILSLMGLIDS